MSPTDAYGIGYAWAMEAPASFDVGLSSLSPVRRVPSSGLEGVVAGGVEWVLREAGLTAVLERVTGDAEALHAAAVVWLEQAVAARGISARLRHGGVAVAGTWRGEASAAFGAAMGECLAALDQLASTMAATAHLLNRAGVAAGAAQDTVTGIVTDAAEWAAAELAATAVADVVTLGLATVGGALAGSATLAAFTARAERISAELATLLEQLATELAVVKAAREAMGAARGVSTLRAVREAREVVSELRGFGAAFRTAEGAADAVIGEVTGLPLGGGGAKSLGSQVRRTISEEAEQVDLGE